MKDLNYNQVIIDSHIHFYDSWGISLDQFLSITFNNLVSNVDRSIRNSTLAIACILDTSVSSESIIETLNSHNQKPKSEWKVWPIKSEPFAYWAKKGNDILLIISGTQINTYEGLEVLLIGEVPVIHESKEISKILKYENSNLLTILPWAVGKWLGKRGKLVTECIKNPRYKNFILGDNGGRPKIWKRVKQFDEAYQKNVILLSGSDPLPVPKGYLNSGGYGNIIPVNIETLSPWTSIINSIYSKEFSSFGVLSTFKGFISNQLKLRL